LIVDDSVVARQRHRVTMADQVTPRISDVRDGGAIMPQRAGHNGRGHLDSAGAGCATRFVYLDVGCLNQALEQRRVLLARGGGVEPCDQRLDGGPRRDLAEFLASNSIRHGEEPPAVGRYGLGMAKEILVVPANPSYVGKLDEFQLKCGTSGCSLV
jgi:hypothetical protein